MSNSITINTGTYLLAILQEDYNHNQGLADSYKEMMDNASTNMDASTRMKDIKDSYKEFSDKASMIFCTVLKLDRMEDSEDVDHLGDLLRNYRVYARMEAIKGQA